LLIVADVLITIDNVKDDDDVFSNFIQHNAALTGPSTMAPLSFMKAAIQSQ